jgi:hypothetical protein
MALQLSQPFPFLIDRIVQFCPTSYKHLEYRLEYNQGGKKTERKLFHSRKLALK